MTDERVTYEFKLADLMAAVRAATKKKSLRDVEDMVGISASTLSRMDNGKVPDMETFMKLCAACNLEPGDYFERVVWVRK